WIRTTVRQAWTRSRNGRSTASSGSGFGRSAIRDRRSGGRMTTTWILVATLLVACSDKGDDSAGGDDGSGDDGSGDDSDTLPSEDADSDGFVAGDDCNDGDPAVNPDATEVCDGVDNDCDGGTDLDATDATAYYT